jgi:hypothetical protein
MDITKITTAEALAAAVNDSMILKQQREGAQRILTQLGAAVTAIKGVKARAVVDAAECDAAIAEIKTNFAAALANY